MTQFTLRCVGCGAEIRSDTVEGLFAESDRLEWSSDGKGKSLCPPCSVTWHKAMEYERAINTFLGVDLERAARPLSKETWVVIKDFLGAAND